MGNTTATIEDKLGKDANVPKNLGQAEALAQEKLGVKVDANKAIS